jgi:hypothetical protein
VPEDQRATDEEADEAESPPRSLRARLRYLLAEILSRTSDPDARRLGPVRKELATFVELFALSGLLVAQPVLDFLGNNAREMVIFRLSVLNVLVFLLLLLVVPPAAFLAFELLVGAIWPGARRRVHIAVMAVLIGVIAGNYVKVSTHVGAGPRIAVSLIVGIAVGFYIIRSSVPQQWLRFLAVAPLIFSMLFVTASPASILLFEDAKAANVTIAHPARVVMIVFDEFPEESLLDGHGHVDAGLFPNFAKLADDSTWYREETTVAEYTVRAVPAILTGKLPAINSALPTASKYPQSLFTLLGKTYKMNAHEFYEQLCPVAMCGGPRFENPINAVLDASSKVMRNLLDLDRSSWDNNEGFRFGLTSLPLGTPLPIAKQFLTSLSPSTKPTLDYLHLMLPHQPWRYLGAGKDHGFTNPSITFLSTFPPDPRKDGLGREMYLLNLQTTDWFLGQVMNKLKAMGEYDNSLIVVTADHGVEFPYRRDTVQSDYDSIMWTPLFIKAPAQAIGRVDNRPMPSIDVLPTMADILGVKIPWKVDGRSALGPRRTPGPVTIIHNDIGTVGRSQTFNGPAGFAKVLRSRAAPPGGDPALRVYRIGPYGALIGRPAAPLVSHSPSRRGTLSTPDGWNNVDPSADYVPWTTATGTITGVRAGTVAIAVNGRVAGLALLTAGGRYDAMLAPTLFRAGKNDVTAYLVAGLPSSPRLVAIAPASPGGDGQSP